MPAPFFHQRSTPRRPPYTLPPPLPKPDLHFASPCLSVWPRSHHRGPPVLDRFSLFAFFAVPRRARATGKEKRQTPHRLASCPYWLCVFSGAVRVCMLAFLFRGARSRPSRHRATSPPKRATLLSSFSLLSHFFLLGTCMRRRFEPSCRRFLFSLFPRFIGLGVRRQRCIATQATENAKITLSSLWRPMQMRTGARTARAWGKKKKREMHTLFSFWHSRQASSFFLSTESGRRPFDPLFFPLFRLIAVVASLRSWPPIVRKLGPDCAQRR